MLRIKLDGGRPTVLVITFSDYLLVGGGTNKVVLDQVRLMRSRGMDVVVLVPYLATRLFRSYDGHWVVYANDSLVGVATTDALVREIARSRDEFCACYLQHCLGVNLADIRRLLDAWDGEVRYYVHDLASLCSSPQMVRPGGSYCGMAHAGGACGDCPLREEGTREYEEYAELFRYLGPRLVPLAPSKSAADMWAVAHGGNCPNEVRVVPHLSKVGEGPVPPTAAGRLRVAFVGQDADIKGAALWDEIATAPFSGDYDIYHFARAGKTRPGVVLVPVDFHAGERAMVDALLAVGIEVAILYSEWPETYSFTYYECLQASAYVVTGSESGNIRAQVEANGNGAVFRSHDDVLKSMSDVGGFTNKIRGWRSAQEVAPVMGTSDGFLEGLDLRKGDARDMHVGLGDPLRLALYLRKMLKEKTAQ